MEPKPDRTPPGSDVALITSGMIEDALADLDQRTAENRDGVLEREPELSGFVHQKLLQIAGKMVMNQVPPHVIQGATTDLHFIVDVSVNAVALAHRRLWDGFLPTPNSDDEGQHGSEEGQEPHSEHGHERPSEEQEDEEGQ